MLKIERILRKKLSNNYDSVRKAFLALDSDHDGFITIEDFMRNFGDNKDLQFVDLKKLI
jgi:Ca2+-binding EF-hand superfamily protein